METGAARVLGAAFVVALGLAGHADASERVAGGPQVAGAISEERRADVLEFWTERRLENARPVPTQEGESPEAAGRRSFGDRTSFEVPDPAAPESRTQGKVFFRQPGDGTFVCSGTAVASLNESVVTTAAHCVADEGEFADSWIFIPAYRDGQRPYGTWVSRALFTSGGWLQTGDGNSDFGSVAVDLAPDGYTSLHDTVGARQIAFGQPRPPSFTSYGYPAAPPFNGERMRSCAGPNLGPDPAMDDAHIGPPGMTMSCDMTQGSSGGGWIGPDGVLATVASHHHPGVPNIKYGPYLRDGLREVFDAAASYGGPPPAPPAEAAFPETSITSKRVRKRKATIAFEGTAVAGLAGFACKLDRKRWKGCSSPAKLKRLRRGRHRFLVRAIDVNGIADPSPARAGFKVKRKRR